MANIPHTYIRLDFSFLPQFELLSNEQFGRMILGIMRNKARGDPIDFQDDEIVHIVSAGILGRIDEDYSAYERKCAINRENGTKGGAPKGNKNAKKTTETTDRLNSTLINQSNNQPIKQDNTTGTIGKSKRATIEDK